MLTLTTFFTASLFVGALLILFSLHVKTQDPRSKIHLDDLLVGEDGRTSKAAFVMFGAFAVTTWILVYLTIEARLDATYFTAYLGAWVAPVVAKLFTNGKKAAAQEQKAKEVSNGNSSDSPEGIRNIG